jgi:hypothetical protein
VNSSPPNAHWTINISAIIRNGQVQAPDKTWFMTPERWTEAVANYEKRMEEERNANLPKEILDALNTLELKVPVTLNDPCLSG